MTLTQNCGYVQGMGDVMNNMVVTFSNWDMGSQDWLDHGKCWEPCDANNTWTGFKNLKFTSGNGAFTQ